MRTSKTVQNVYILTRLKQLNILLLFLVPSALGLSAITEGPFIWYFFTAALTLSTLNLYASFKILPSGPDTAKIEGNAIVFEKLGTIQFSDIIEFNYDDYLKIRRRGDFFSILLHDKKPNFKEHAELVENFKFSFGKWRRTQIEAGSAYPRQIYFYGSWKAFLLAMLLIFGYLFAMILTWQYSILDIRLAFGAATAPLALRLLLIESRPDGASFFD